jgi:hypothetical protein
MISARFAKVVQLALVALTLGACSDDDGPNFTYGKGDMERVVVGTWRGTWTEPGGEPSELTLDIRSGHEPGSLEPSCNDRVLSHASQPGLRVMCESSSVLRVSGSLSVADGSWDETQLAGEYSIWSLNLGPGMLSLATDDAALQLSAEQDEDGAWRSCRAASGGVEIACTLYARR